jgi:hypothetical protein
MSKPPRPRVKTLGWPLLSLRDGSQGPSQSCLTLVRHHKSAGATAVGASHRLWNVAGSLSANRAGVA